MNRPGIDLRKLRERLRIQQHDTIFAMLDSALELLSPAKLEKLVGRFIRLDELRSESTAPSPDTPARLYAAVKEFIEASHRGDWFESFDVDSGTFTEQSNGTTAWIGECDRLLGRCKALSTRRRGAGEVLTSFELLFELIEQAGSCDFEIVFFADEGGTWAFGFDWAAVVPAWLDCLERSTAGDVSFEHAVAEVLGRKRRFPSEVSEVLLGRVHRKRGTPGPGTD